MDVAAVVRRHRDALLGTAFLLCGDERSAEDRVDRALSRLAPDDDHAAAVRALVRTRPPRGAVAEAGADPWWVSPAELATARATAAALDALAAADRTALVLDHEGLPADQDRLTRARARVSEPAAALSGLLAVRRPPTRDGAAAVPVVAAHRRARWTRPVIAAAALVALALAATLVPGRGPAPAAADRFAGPVRGSLAGDSAFVDTARDTPWADGSDPDRPRVVFAGDLLDRRWVLLVADTPRGPVGQWLTAGVGAPAADLAPANPPVALHPDGPAALLLDTDLVVVADTDEGVRVSTGQVVGPSGAVQRVFRPQPVDDGVAALRLAAPDPGGLAVRVQVARAGEYSALTLTDVPVTLAGSTDATSRTAVTTPLRGSEPDAGARQAAVAAAVLAVSAPTGLDPASLAPVLLWAGQVPHPLTGPVDAAVVAVRQPSGALVVSTAWADRLENGTVQQVGCGARAYPAGTDPVGLAVAARCVVADRNTGLARATVLLTTPSGTTLVPDDTRTTDVVVDPADGSSVPVSAAGPTDLFAG